MSSRRLNGVRGEHARGIDQRRAGSQEPKENVAKVLIVDDDVVLGRFLQIGLSRSGHEVKRAETREDAYSIAPAFRPDVLIVDWMLTDVDGVELAEILRARLPDLAVVLITGNPCEEVARKAEVAGISPVLAKPVALAELNEAIEKATAAKL